MRILHTSDWHLGRQFYNQSLLDDQRHVLNQLIDQIEALSVDVVVVAGDIYDRSVPPAAAVDLLSWVVDEICHRLGVPLIAISGNHDGPERLAFAAKQLAAGGLHIVGPLWQDPVRILLSDRGGTQVAFYPIPYADPVTVRYQHGVDVTSHDEAMAYLIGRIEQVLDDSVPAVAIAHCFLAGGEASESERPLAIGGVECVAPERFAAFSYSALGHLHGQQYRHMETIRYSGTPLKYSFSEERHRKSFTLVDIDSMGQVEIQTIPLIPQRDMRTIEGGMNTILAAGKNDPAAADYVQIRLSDRQAILDVMNKLRAVYPNVLHLERPGLINQNSAVATRNSLQRGTLQMFEDFFQQVTDRPLSPEQRSVVADELKKLQEGDG